MTKQQSVRTGKDHTGWRVLTIWWLPAKEDTLQNNCPNGSRALGFKKYHSHTVTAQFVPIQHSLGISCDDASKWSSSYFKADDASVYILAVVSGRT